MVHVCTFWIKPNCGTGKSWTLLLYHTTLICFFLSLSDFEMKQGERPSNVHHLVVPRHSAWWLIFFCGLNSLILWDEHKYLARCFHGRTETNDQLSIESQFTSGTVCLSKTQQKRAHQKDAAKGADALTWICWTVFWLHFAVYIYVIIGNMLILIISWEHSNQYIDFFGSLEFRWF